MYLQCTTEESAKRQRQFELVLLEMIEVKPFAQITVGQLCEKVGISRNAFYRYFDGKIDVLYALIDHTLMDCYKTRLDHPQTIDSYREEIEPFLRYWMEQKPLLDALEKNNMDGKLLERCMRHITQRHFDEDHYPLLGTGEGRHQVMLFAISGIFSLILDWHHKKYQQPVPQMIETMERIMLKPLVSLPEK